MLTEWNPADEKAEIALVRSIKRQAYAERKARSIQVEEIPTPSEGQLAQILTEVAAKHGVSVMAMISHRRPTVLARARHECWWRAREETAFSLPQIGRAYNRDHTSIIHGIRMHEKRMAEAQA